MTKSSPKERVPASTRQGFEVEIVDPRFDSEPSGWAKFRRIVPCGPMWDYELLRLEAWLSRNPPVLAVLREGGRVLGACVAMLCSPRSPLRKQEFAPRSTGRLRRYVPCWAEVYLPWFSGHSAIVFRDGMSAEQRRELLRLFERRLAEYVGVGLLGVVYRALPAEIARICSRFLLFLFL